MKLFAKKSDTSLQDLIDTAQTQLFTHDVDTPEYAAALEKLERLYKLKNLSKDFHVSPDALLAVAGNIAGIMLILNFERIGVITSKAFGLLIKAKM